MNVARMAVDTTPAPDHGDEPFDADEAEIVAYHVDLDLADGEAVRLAAACAPWEPPGA